MRGTGGGGGRSSIGGGSQRGRSGGGSQNSPASASPRLPAGINLPHEELAIVAANYTDTHLEEGVFSGKLTQSGADLLLVPPGSSQLPPKGSAGTFRLWIKDGAVTKYELKLTAETTPSGASVNGGFSETITVDLSNVGSTKFEVPDAAKRKLGV